MTDQALHAARERHEQHRNVGMNTDMMSLAFDALELAREDSRRIVDDMIAAAAGVNDKMDENASRLEKLSEDIPALLSEGIAKTGDDLDLMLSKIDVAAAAHQKKIDAAANAHHAKFSEVSSRMLSDIQIVIDHKVREVALTASAAATRQLNADIKKIAESQTANGMSVMTILMISVVSSLISAGLVLMIVRGV